MTRNASAVTEASATDASSSATPETFNSDGFQKSSINPPPSPPT